MTRDWIFVPVIVQVLLTLLIYVRLINVKVREMRAGRVDMDRRGLHEEHGRTAEEILGSTFMKKGLFSLAIDHYKGQMSEVARRLGPRHTVLTHIAHEVDATAPELE